MDVITHRTNPIFEDDDGPVPGDAVAINMQPSIIAKQPALASAKYSSSSSRENEEEPTRRNSKVADPKFIDNSDYLESFVVGGGTLWLYALFDVFIKMMVIAKQMGVPMAGQTVEILTAIRDNPLGGAMIKFMCGAVTRSSYMFSGTTAAAHPPLSKVWSYVSPDDAKVLGISCTAGTIDACYKLSSCDCTGCCLGLAKSHRGESTEPLVAPLNRFPFPETIGALRGTPMHTTISNFDNTIYGNEHGEILDLAINGKERGFSVRMKTGNVHAVNPGEDLFTVSREPRTGRQTLLNMVLMFGCEQFMQDSDKSAVVTSSSGQQLGKIQASIQKPPFWDRYFRTRFSARDFPLYDILGADGEIKYTVLVPVKRFNPACLPPTYYDENFLLLVEGKMATPPAYGTQPRPWQENYKNPGWVIPITPQHEKCLDNCMQKSKLCFTVATFLTLGMFAIIKAMGDCVQACMGLFRTCPVDNYTQVPWPGDRKDLHNTFPCTHCLSSTRIAVPPKASVTRGDRMLFMALSMRIDMDLLWSKMGTDEL